MPKIYKYIVNRIQSDSIELSQKEGEQLKLKLLKDNPDWVHIKNHLVKTNQIQSVDPKPKKKVDHHNQWGKPVHRQVERSLTKEEKSIREEFERLSGENNLPKLNA